MWLILKEPRRFGWHWAACWVCIIYGVVTTVFGSIGGLRSIIVKVRLLACSQTGRHRRCRTCAVKQGAAHAASTCRMVSANNMSK